jgi:hypothetical protein
MTIDKETNENIKTISSEEKKGIEGANEPAFSKGLYDWLMILKLLLFFKLLLVIHFIT